MANLYPTLTRLGFLQDVADGRVWFRTGARPDEDHGRLDIDGHMWTCTARVVEAYRAEWVYLDGDRYDDGYRPVRLSDAGRAVLDGAP